MNDAGGALLLLFLAAAWAAVLIPATRSSRDAAYDGRSMQGFSTAMRVLSRRSQGAEGRYIVMPTTEVPGDRMRRRRRRILVRLVWASGLSLVAAVFLGGPWPVLHGVADVLLVGYVVGLRRIHTRRAELARRARRVELARREAAHRAAYEAIHRAGHGDREQAGSDEPAERRSVAVVEPPAYERRRAVND